MTVVSLFFIILITAFAVVAGVHGLQHVQGLASAHLAQHDAIRAHTKSVNHQFALTNCSFALDVRRTALHSDDVRLLQLQFGRVFDRNDSFPLGDKTR